MANHRSEKRTHEITIRVTANELQKLKDRKTEATLAGWMRNIGLGMTPIKQADPDLVRALGRIGSNLNQVAKHTNTNNELDRRVLTEIITIRKILNRLVEQNLQSDN